MQNILKVFWQKRRKKILARSYLKINQHNDFAADLQKRFPCPHEVLKGIFGCCALTAMKQLNPFTRAILMAKHAWAVFRAKNTPRYVKLILALGLAYIVSPWDLVPE